MKLACACANLFLELPLTIQFRHYLGMNATSCYWSNIDFFALFIIIYLLTLTILTQPLEQNSEAAAGGVLKNFANFTGKHLCWSLFFTKLQAFRPATLLKIDSYTSVFLWNLRNSEEHLFWRTSERLLLCIDYFIIYWFLQSSTGHVLHFYK